MGILTLDQEVSIMTFILGGSARDGVILAADTRTLGPGEFELAQRNPSVSNQQKWDTLGAERSGAGWRSGELPEGPVVASSPFGGLSPHLLPAL